MFKDQDDRLRTIRMLNDIERNLSLYIGTVTAINFGIGVITTVGAWILGFSHPVLIGALAYLCNYIPYVGPAFMVLVLFAVGLVTFPSLAYAAIAPVPLFVALTTFEGHIVTPNIVNRRLTLNPLGVFLEPGILGVAVGADRRFPVVVPFLDLRARHRAASARRPDDVELPD